jgi:hypothetical protein
VEKWFPFLRHDNLLAEHVRLIALLRRYREAAQLPAHDRDASLVTIRADFEPSTFCLLTGSCGWSLGTPDSADRIRLGHLRSTIAALIAERYRRQHGSWPASLDVVQKQTKVKLIDPFDGKPLHYGKFGDGMVLYSIGEDRKDNGGKLNRANLDEERDTGVRLWDVAKRRQPAPPPR